MLIRTKSWHSITSGPGPRHRLRLSAAHDEWNHVGIALTAMEEGYLAHEGLTEVELVTFPEETGALLDREAGQVDLLAKGAVDIGIDPRTTFVLEAKSEGQPVCIVAARRKNHAFILVGQKGLESIDDLRGTTLFTSLPGGANDVMLRQVLRDSGIDPEEDVTISYTGGDMHDSAGAMDAFREGGYGPAVLSSRVGPLIEEGFPVLADLRTLYHSRHDRVTGANEDFTRAHPELVAAFLKGMIRACNFVVDRTNAQRFKEIIVGAGYLTTEREKRNFDSLFEGWQERVSRDLTLPQDGIDLIVKEEKEAGRIPLSFDVQHVLRLDPLEQAQRELTTRG